jgi:hypothetical protein
MTKYQYAEGPQATKNFEEGMKALFKAPKGQTAKPTKRTPKVLSVRKTKRSDKD